MITRQNHGRCTWIGLFRLSGPPENVHLQGCLGAYVTVLAVAGDETEFERRVADAADAIGLAVEEAVWREPLAQRLERYHIEDYLVTMAREASETGEVRFGVFDVWEAEE